MRRWEVVSIDFVADEKIRIDIRFLASSGDLVDSSAFIKLGSSTMAPQAVFMRKAPCFMAEKSAWYSSLICFGSPEDTNMGLSGAYSSDYCRTHVVAGYETVYLYCFFEHT